MWAKSMSAVTYMFMHTKIVDFVIWLLFSRKSELRPKHLLCDGFRRQAIRADAAASGTDIPGLYSIYPNQQVRALKGSPWPELLMLLGKEGERIMIDLLVDCSIFRTVKAGKGNLYQLSGIPLSDLEPLPQFANKTVPLPADTSQKNTELSPSEISFVRSRMLYARAALNARGLVHFGIRHIRMSTPFHENDMTLMPLDVLNRFPYKGPSAAEGDGHEESTARVMMYMFPRQFGLHNVFTSPVDHQQTSQKFQDYTLREEEITNKYPAPDAGGKPTWRIPKRLRGTATDLVRRLQVLHKRCAYAEMLQHYCPVSTHAGY